MFDERAAGSSLADSRPTGARVTASSLADVIREAREARGLSQRQLAAKARVSQPYLAQLENGTRRRPAFDVVVRIANGLGVSLDELVKGHGRDGPRRRASSRDTRPRRRKIGSNNAR